MVKRWFKRGVFLYCLYVFIGLCFTCATQAQEEEHEPRQWVKVTQWQKSNGLDVATFTLNNTDPENGSNSYASGSKNLQVAKNTFWSYSYVDGGLGRSQLASEDHYVGPLADEVNFTAYGFDIDEWGPPIAGQQPREWVQVKLSGTPADPDDADKWKHHTGTWTLEYSGSNGNGGLGSYNLAADGDRKLMSVNVTEAGEDIYDFQYAGGTPNGQSRNVYDKDAEYTGILDQASQSADFDITVEILSWGGPWTDEDGDGEDDESDTNPPANDPDSDGDGDPDSTDDDDDNDGVPDEEDDAPNDPNVSELPCDWENVWMKIEALAVEFPSVGSGSAVFPIYMPKPGGGQLDLSFSPTEVANSSAVAPILSVVRALQIMFLVCAAVGATFRTVRQW